jgi:hypothetical protein
MSIASIIFIFLVHNLLSFFKTTLTVPKIKDLVNSPNQKYQNIYDTISHTDANTIANATNVNTTNANTIANANIGSDSTVSMKNELKSFLKKQMNKDTNNDILNNDILNNDILGMNSMSYSYMNI